MTDAPERIWAFPKKDWFNAGASTHRITAAGAKDVEYIRADRAAPAVKELVWEGEGFWSHGPNEGWMEEATTPFGWGYSVEFGRDGDFKIDSTFNWSQDGFETPEEAKAAAQADFERRVRECLK